MMSSRTLEAPGIELKEIDRSKEQKPDYSLPNAPACLVTGLASKGEDYTVQWVNSKSTLDECFGTPENEPETWFYNAICEILDRGGVALAAKIPYDNASLQKYTFRQWELSNSPTSIFGASSNDINILRAELQAVLDFFVRRDDISSISQMWAALKSIAVKEAAAEIEVEEETIDEKTYQIESLRFDYSRKPEGLSDYMFQKMSNLASSIGSIIRNLTIDPYSILSLNDSEITSYIKIVDDGSGVADLDTLDKHLTYSKALIKNKIRVYDITRSQYEEYDKKNFVSSLVENEESSKIVWTNDCLGIVPVLVTAPNAMYFQGLLQAIDTSFTVDGQRTSQLGSEQFNVLSGFGTLQSGKVGSKNLNELVSADFSSIDSYTTIPLVSKNQTEDTTSKEAALIFPEVNWEDSKHFEKNYLKHIGVVVFKAFKDLANDSNISFTPVEAFVGSLDRTAKDKISHASIFIDDVVNSRSKLIRLFSNADKKNLDNTSTLAICNQRATSLGFHRVQCRKTVTLKTTVMDALGKILDQCKDPNTVPLDLVVDAGVSNLAQLIQSASTNAGYIDFELYPRIADFGTKESETFCACGYLNDQATDARAWRLSSMDDTRVWRQVLSKFDSFCKFTRKDCLFLADGLRTFCLEGDEKLVRRTKPSSSIMETIVPKVKYISDALNSSYSAGWCDWFYMPDIHTGDLFWCPPSVKAASICIYCDTYFHPWEAPAGMLRGIVPNVVDVAFSPTNEEAGKMYNHQWNYAISYPREGIVMEGQKTFQTEKTALDRVNVRRLMLDLEKKTIQIARHFLYEGNTEWLRQRFVDQLTPIFEDAIVGDGILDYAIKCDEELNTEQTIENHELHCKIGIKPVKTVEWIVLSFIITRQGADVAEEVLR